MTIGEKIKHYRTQNKMTQKQLGEKCGLAEITIRQYEADKYIPKIGNLQKIAAALNVPLFDFVGAAGNFDWGQVAKDFPNASVYEVKDEIHVGIGDIDEKTAYIHRITFSLDHLNLEGLRITNEFITKLSQNDLYTQEPPTTE